MNGLHRGERRGWRVGHLGRDRMYYEELRDGSWQRIAIDGEMLTGRAHHVIYFGGPERWQRYPAWAQERREEIIARIKSEFRAPDYEYDDAPTAAPPVTGSPSASPRRRATVAAASSQGMRALTVAIVLMLVTGAGMSWLVVRGVRTGEAYFPTRRVSQQRAVSRALEPVTFWIAIALYGAIAVGALGMGAWGIREGMTIGKGGARRD